MEFVALLSQAGCLGRGFAAYPSSRAKARALPHGESASNSTLVALLLLHHRDVGDVLVLHPSLSGVIYRG